MEIEHKPAQVFCLAEYLVEEMEARNWTTVDVAVRMSEQSAVRRKLELDLILAVTPTNDGCLIGDEVLIALAGAFGVSDEFFKKLHVQWIDNPDIRSSFEAPEHIFGVS